MGFQDIPLVDCGDGKVRAEAAVFSFPIVAKTTSYTVKAGESGKCFSNRGAGGAVVFTLPTPKEGMTFTFLRIVPGQQVTITPPSGVKIQNQTAGQSVKSTTADSTNVGIIRVVGISTTEYMVMSEAGPWTMNDGTTVIP